LPDAAVVAFSGRFHWVEVNRDRAPGDAITKRFNVSAFPSFITVNHAGQEIYRFQSYMKPPEFLKELSEALRRWRLFKSGQPWDDPNPRPATICESATVESFRAPGSGVCGGLAWLDGDLLVAQWPDRLPGQESERKEQPVATLFRLDAATGEVKGRAPIPTAIADLCVNGGRLYGVESGWTAGLPIHEIDPATGKGVREIVTEANKTNKSYGAKGIAAWRGRLFVLDGMPGTINEVDEKTGDIVRTLKTGEKWLAGLTTEGDELVAGSRTAIVWVDPETGEVKRKIPVNYSIRAIEACNGALYVMEQPVFGYDKDHHWIEVWPRPGQTVVYKLTWPARRR
jgi:hypothetical protein